MAKIKILYIEGSLGHYDIDVQFTMLFNLDVDTTRASGTASGINLIENYDLQI